jgi:diguanylate cyclase (GGDEF)-like protein
MTQPSKAQKKLFLSLKWKVVLGISLVLISVNLVVSLVTYNQVLIQFEQNRLTTQLSYKKGFEGLVSNSFDRMKQLAYIIPLLKSKVNPDENHTGSDSFEHDLQQIINQHASLLQIEYNLNGLAYYREPSQAMVVWNEFNLPDSVKKMLQKSLLDEVPGSTLECQQSCNLFTATPLLNQDGTTGLLLLSASLVDLVVEFASITDADIGLISLGSKNQNMPDLSKNWGANLIAVSHADELKKVLNRFSQQITISEALKKPQQFKWQKMRFEIQLIPLNKEQKKNTTLAVVISDISDELKQIDHMALNTFLTGLVGLLVSEIMLFIILWFPMRDIGYIVDVLPMFPKKAFISIREQLKAQNRERKINDEINLLSDSVFELSLQLEDLHIEIDNKTQGLLDRTHDLAREQEFINGLLNTTQAVILTQDVKGQILMLNKKGEQLINVNCSDKYCSFDDVLADNESKRDTVFKLDEIRKGDRKHFHHEAEITCTSKPYCMISWYHSLLSITGDDGAVVLSVGLDITERKMAEDQLEWLADHDPLTGLYNRRRFQNEVARLIAIARQYKQTGALLYFDVDHFKYLNDTQGHQVGDRILQQISETLTHIVKKPDVIARLGGDEFAVVLPTADKSAAKKVAQRIIENIRLLEARSMGASQKISVSIGVVMFPDDGFDIPELMANVDLAMYQAKENKRGSYHLFSSDDKALERVKQLMLRKQRIEQAIADERFILYFQPILNLKTNTIERYETLIRLKEKDGTIKTPDTFIREAEDLGLIDDIDRLVLKKAIKALRTFHNDGFDLSLSVNLSGKAMDNPNILKLIQEQLKLNSVDPSKLIIELTETAAVSDIVGAERLMHEIKALGCHFALDDFGVGFSSFFYLKQLPVDYVKLDGMFIRQLPYSDEDQIFVKALNEMAHGLAKETVAEFVENDQILDMLKQYDVDFAQGYYVGKPKPDIIRE